jgi:hypothetical protein
MKSLLSALVLSDENPIYEDANANGIDDAFEKQQRGSLLPFNVNRAEHQLLAEQWRTAQREKAPPAFYTKRLLPDDARR